MKKIIAILVLTLSTTVAFAQETNENYKIKAKSELDNLKKTVELTKDQEVKLLKIYYKIQETVNSPTLDREVKEALIKELKEKEAKILAEKK